VDDLVCNYAPESFFWLPEGFFVGSVRRLTAEISRFDVTSDHKNVMMSQTDLAGIEMCRTFLADSTTGICDLSHSLL